LFILLGFTDTLSADALFICHQIDSEAGGHHSDEAKKAFAGEIFRGDAIV
jgi:hypothetical protein